MSSLLFVSGSLRRGSVNSAAIRAARRAAVADPRVEGTNLLRIELPFYNGDDEKRGVPRTVLAVRAAVAAGDALVISTPSYNAAVPGGLKNLLDWLSRPADASVLADKVVATMSASPGRHGGVEAQLQLRAVLARIGAFVLPHDPLVAITDAAHKCVTGELTDDAALSDISALMHATVSALHSTLLSTGAH